MTSDEDSRLRAQRDEMVEQQLVRRGVADPRVLAAMAALPRHCFVEPSLRHLAYEDRPLPIGGEQTISQPFMVARATELAAPQAGQRALEVGSGCGYQLALLAGLCGEAYGIELLPVLAARARATLQALAITNAVVESFDGSGGWSEHAPYDVIIVSAGAPRVPPLLVAQLADGGRLVIPVGPPEEQQLVVVRRTGDSYETTFDTRCRYVNLLGQYGFGRTPPLA
ncbi:MAG TPA: protein-L-isoaspartate(D-aspartate) O-methyltransferase [Polyangia bacterium]